MTNENQIRWGIVGCGDVVRRRVAGAIHAEENSRLVAACRRNPNQLRAFCDEFEVDRGYERAEDLINDPEVDAVYIATPVYLHLPQTIAAARAGKHVLVEKPMAMTVAECDQMIDVCRKNDVRLGVAYYRRFYPVVDRIKELLSARAIGKPLAVSVITATEFAMGSDDDGFWRVIPGKGGGGALMDIGSHRINLLLDVFGKIDEVKCQCATVAADYNAEDSASLLLRFHCGIQGSLQCFFGPNHDPDEFSVIGTKGRLVAAPLNDGVLSIQTVSGIENEQHPPASNFNTPLIADFVTAIRENRVPRVSGEEGRATNRVMERAYENARE
jgi:predicted dehydrogenase